MARGALKRLGHKPLSTSSLDGRTTYISKCDSCPDCTREWLLQRQEGKVSVSEAGSCTGNLNLKRLQRLNAKKYASTKTPGQALVEMEKDGVAADQRPPAYILQNYWPGKGVQKERNTCDCISSLLAFCRQPPDHVVVDRQSMVCTSEEVRIGFQFDMSEKVLGKLQLPSWVMDGFTLKTKSWQE